MTQDITTLFNKFASKEIEMNENTQTLKIGGKDYTFTEVRLANAKDPTVTEMKATAAKAGLSLRLWFPGTIGTMDYRLDRVNAHIEKEADGKYRVSSRFNLG